MKHLSVAFVLFLALAPQVLGQGSTTPLKVDKVDLSGHLSEERAELTISANLLNRGEREEQLLYTTEIQDRISVDQTEIRQQSDFHFSRVQGLFKSITIGFEGDQLPKKITGNHLATWSIKHPNGMDRSLVLEFKKDAFDLNSLRVSIEMASRTTEVPSEFAPTTWQLEHPSLGTGEIVVSTVSSLTLSALRLEGLAEQISTESDTETRFRFQGTQYSAEFKISPTNPDDLRVLVSNMKIDGHYSDRSITFDVKGNAATKNPNGASIAILSGEAALTQYSIPVGSRLNYIDGAYILKLEGPGTYPINYQFEARIQTNETLKQTAFNLPAANLFPLSLTGVPLETEIQLTGSGPLEPADGNRVRGFLPANGKVRLAWQQQVEEQSSRLFFNTKAQSEIRIGTGVMRQSSTIELRIMQGELESLDLDVTGSGEITRVTAPGLLSWELEEVDNTNRSLSIRFNQAQTSTSLITITTVATVGDFPVQVTPMRITPRGSDRHHGAIEVINDGAVRLNVLSTSGLSRITPETAKSEAPQNQSAHIYPEQKFAFRHSSSDYSLTVQATMIEPDIATTALMLYHLDYDQTRIDADLEIEIREAPIRDFEIHLPIDYVLANVTSHQLSDFFLTPSTEEGINLLRLVFSRPIIGRHQIQLRLERNAPLTGTVWALEQVVPQETRQLRGHIGITSIEGYRITPNVATGLTEIATVYFPRKTEGLQAAFRLTETTWNLTVNATPIPQSVQADSFHMYTLGNGIINGSSLIHFDISGAPLDTLEFNVPAEYRNIEFTGEDVRNWSQTGEQYTVTLQSPIIGTYTLLATFERSFSDAADTLTATGITPLNTASEQGTIVISSNRQIQLDDTTDSTDLVQLTPEELSPDQRLLIQQPVIAAYQFTQRPFALGLSINTLAEANTTRQIIDRAEINTRIAHDGQTVSTLRYIVKTSGTPHLRLNLPEGNQLWAATVDQKKVVPINTADAILIPLPPDGKDLRIVELKLANAGSQATPVRIELPALEIPVLHSQWHLEPAPKQRLTFLSGNMLPDENQASSNGYLQFQQLLSGMRPWNRDTGIVLVISFALLLLGTILFRFARSTQIHPFQWRRRMCVLIASLSALVGILLVGSISLDALDRIPQGKLDLNSQASITSPNATSFVVVENRPDHLIAKDVATLGWPLLIAGIVWLVGRRQLSPTQTPYLELAVWIISIVTILQWTIGGPLAIILLFTYFLRHLMIPAIALFHRTKPSNQVAPITTAIILYGLLSLQSMQAATSIPYSNHIPDKVEQQIQIVGDHVIGHVVMQWNAEKNQIIALLREPGLITHIKHDSSKTRISDNNASPRTVQLIALESGEHEIRFDYQVPIPSKNKQRGFELPIQHGLINKIDITLKESNSKLLVNDSISVTPIEGPDPEASYWKVIPLAKNGIQIRWEPRRRNRSEEKAVYFAEWTHLLTPSSGLVEGFHDLAIRPAQGEISQVSVTLPNAITINEVIANDLANWRFDPDRNRVLINLKSPQSKPFLVRILSQAVTQPLPYTSSQTFPRIDGATGQVGSAAIAAESDIQISGIVTQDLVSIDPQDFRTVLLDICQQQFPSATIRQAFRYTDPAAVLEFKANEVAPHITVTTSERLSLGEDRILLASQIQVQIARAGIFNLSFFLPDSLGIDSITGDQLSHWSELTNDAGRRITLHLKQRWQGALRFDLTLSGAGLTDTNEWSAPKITIEEANRQRGQLVLVPEQGIRLQTSVRDNTSQVDARKGGFRANGALAFDLLNADWNLVFSLEQVAPWIETASLQDVLFSEGKATVTNFLDCQVKNTAVKSFDLNLPSNASNVRFEGKHFGDAILNETTEDNRQHWTVRLERRIIGPYRLTLTYQIRLDENASSTLIQGTQIQNTSSQRGYLTLRSLGRLQIEISQIPEALYHTDWNNIPRTLRQSLPEDLAVSQSYRIVDPSFDLPITVSRHEVTPVLPAQVNEFNLTTIIATTGTTLTKAAIKVIPGSKRSLAFSLPPNSQFWFARVNNQGVATWSSGDQLLVPLTQSLSEDTETLVELFVQNPSSPIEGNQLESTLHSLNIDLPANAISWTVILDPKWNFKEWGGDLELISKSDLKTTGDADLDDFIRDEFSRREGRTKQAESWLEQGNQFLNAGNDTLAKNAFKNAYGLTQHDAAFNEDARIQLRTVKTQQAMAGISVQQRQSTLAVDSQQLGPKLPLQSAQQILAESDPANENTLLNLADRLIAQHEDAAQTTRGFDITLPMRGTRLHFVKSVQVDSTSDLNLTIQASSRSNPAYLGTAILIIIAMVGTTLVRQRFTEKTA